MLGLLIVTTAVLGAGPGASPPDPWDSYEVALAQVGRDADAHVRLALWCEARGLTAERLKHLSLAVLKDPKHPMARGLLGMVLYQGRWRRPEDVGTAAEADARRKALMVEYEQKRDKIPEKAEAHWKLALWCAENGLKDESVAHLWSSVRLDPSREAAWKRLGYRKQHDGRWMTDAQVSRKKEEAISQARADKRWRPLLEKWREQLAAKDLAKRAEAGDALDGVTDPRAVPMVWAVFATGDVPEQRMAVQLLGQIDATAASHALALMAVTGKSGDVRRAATESLRTRDVREYAGPLIALLRDPIKYEVRPLEGTGKSGSIFIDGKRVNVQRRYTAPQEPVLNLDPRLTGIWTVDADGLPMFLRTRNVSGYIDPVSGSYALAGRGMTPVPFLPMNGGVTATAWQGTADRWNDASIRSSRTAAGGAGVMSNNASQVLASAFFNGQPIMIGRAILATKLAGEAAERQLQNDKESLARYNEGVEENNRRVLPVLQDATGLTYGGDREAWQRWLVDQFGFAQRVSDQQPNPTIVQEFTPDLPPVSGFATTPTGYSSIVLSHHSCFGAGTLVHTISGKRPIESLRVGDVVLSEDTRTGQLNYRPIVVVYHNPPIETYRVSIGDETIVSSAFHRFWKSGKGWVMARDLKSGDQLRTLGGAAAVTSIESDAKQPVFNLDVAEDADFFVGGTGALVHDHTLPDLRTTPFDAPSGLAATSRR